MATRRKFAPAENLTSAAPKVSGPSLATDLREWLETDGLGGFASGALSLVRTRRCHALLAVAGAESRGRFVLVNGCEAFVTTPAGRFALSSHRYAPGITHPDGASRLISFTSEPWPRWVFECADGTRIANELFARQGLPLVALSWKRLGEGPARLELRPLLSGRDARALHRENDAFEFAADERGEGQTAWRPYAGMPEVLSLSSGRYEHAPLWYRQFAYEADRTGGRAALEDLASPAILAFDLAEGEAAWILAEATDETRELLSGEGAGALLARLRGLEKRRRRFADRLERAGDAYIVRRGRNRSILAGYPWHGEYGRDAFIALRGLCLATGRTEDARRVLIHWCGALKEGLLPERLDENGGAVGHGPADAPLWFVVAVHDFLEAAATAGRRVSAPDRLKLRGAVAGILEAYLRGTRSGIRADRDGLLIAGEPGAAPTWMNARGAHGPHTPRDGKAVELQALWINALLIGASISARWSEPARRARDAFERRFWNAERGCLNDVVDAGGVPGRVDDALRPNQLFAIGGLPFESLKGDRARSVVDVCEEALWTPLGCRTLAPGETGYVAGDGAHHQGAVWPWLAGAFIEAWVRVRGSTPAARREARERFFTPLIERIDLPGFGHLPERAGSEAPHAPEGAPFQAWSVGEALRLDRQVLGEVSAGRARRARVSGAAITRSAR